MNQLHCVVSVPTNWQGATAAAVGCTIVCLINSARQTALRRMPLAPFQVNEDTDIVDCAAVVEINTHISLVVGSLAAAAIAATVQWSLALMLVEDRRRIPTMLVAVIFFAGGEDVVHSSSALGGSGDGTR